MTFSLSLLTFSSLWAFTASAASLDCPTHPSLELVKKKDAYCLFSGSLVRQDPVDPTATRKIPYQYYFSRQARGSAPLALVYPSLSDELPIVETLLSQKFVRRGMHAIIVELVEDIADVNRAPETINDFFIRSNWSSREILNECLTWNEIQTESVFAVGVSLGGIRAVTAFGEEPRLKRMVTYVAGGNLPEIFAYSKVKFIQTYRDFWKKKLGLTSDAAFAEYLRPLLKVDPLLSAKNRPAAGDVYLVMGGKDEKVPFKNQMELYEAFGRPKSRVSVYGHRIAGASFLVKFPEITEFLLQ